jgi:hypothetical protein
VNLTRQPVALLGRAQPGAPGKEPGSLDGDAQQIPDRVEQLQVFRREPSPVRAGNVHDAELFVLSVERDAGVVAEAIGAVHQAIEAAAGEHVDVRRALEVTPFISIEAVAVAGSIHTAGIVRQSGRQVLGGSQVGL